MKQFILICLLLFLGNFYSQGNLQFNQVLNFQSNVSQPCGGPGNVFNYTVPMNKVWRIESLHYTRGHTLGSFSFQQNGVVFLTTTSTNTPDLKLPVFLNAGSVFTISFSNTA